MAFSTLIVSVLDDPLPWAIAGIILGGTAIAFFTFLWFFRVIRLIVTKNLSCPEEKRRATVELIAQIGELGPYRDVRSCSLQEGGISCRKGCLTSSAAIEAPSLAIRRQKIAV